uniref:Helicase C-terminal domain-containing protein n=1 Tax=Gongylonema pulchrum TaxID=637853 RepID=A0A183EUG1_9BILA
LEIHKNEPPGDILIFLTGQDEVESASKRLIEAAKDMRRKNLDRLWVVPMYGALPASEQLKAFDSTTHGTRKIVVATNIAETSLTIPGIAYVIDCGFVKLRAMNRENGFESLMKLPISQASAQQRAGRAGRIRPGKCYRLYTRM